MNERVVRLEPARLPARSLFDRYDIMSEEDVAEASRKVAELTGTIIAGTKRSATLQP